MHLSLLQMAVATLHSAITESWVGCGPAHVFEPPHPHANLHVLAYTPANPVKCPRSQCGYFCYSGPFAIDPLKTQTGALFTRDCNQPLSLS